MRRMKRMHHFRQVQINAMTRPEYLGVIGLERCGDGCVSRLRPLWQNNSKDLITRLKEPILKSNIDCFRYDSVRYHRFPRYGTDLIKLEATLSKNTFLPKLDRINLGQSRNRIAERRLRYLEKAEQVNCSNTATNLS